MRAAILKNVGDSELEVRDDVSLVDLGPNQVKVKIEAAGLCHSDLSAMTGVLPQPTPLVLGHEGSGIILAVGEGVTNVKEGDHVIIDWNSSCGTCNFCLRGETHLCLKVMFGSGMVPKFQSNSTPVFGFAGNGTFAEEMIVSSNSVVRIPEDIPFDVAALIGCGVATGVGAAINTAKVKPGSSVAVIGCGGVGIAAIQGAKIAGAAEIVAIDTVEKKLSDAKHFGATHGVTPEEANQAYDKVTASEGFDYVFECIGLSKTAKQAIDLTRRGGTTVIVGAGKQDDEFSLNMWELFFNAKTLISCYYGSSNTKVDFLKLIRLYKAGRLDLENMISAKMDISKINSAVDALKKGEVIRQVLTF